MYNKGIGNCHFWQGAYQEAIRYGLLAHDDLVESGNQKRQAHACYDLAEAYSISEEIESGRQYFVTGTQIAQTLGDEQLLRDFQELEREYPTLNLHEGLNERQKAAIDHVKQHGSITNRRYRELTGISQKQGARDLGELVERGIFIKVGQGRATRYEIDAKVG